MEFVSWDDAIPNVWKKTWMMTFPMYGKNMFQTTNQ